LNWYLEAEEKKGGVAFSWPGIAGWSKALA